MGSLGGPTFRSVSALDLEKRWPDELYQAKPLRRADAPVCAGQRGPRLAQTVRGGRSMRPETTLTTCSSPAIDM